MNRLLLVVLALLLAALGWQTWRLADASQTISTQADELRSKSQALAKSNSQLISLSILTETNNREQARLYAEAEQTSAQLRQRQRRIEELKREKHAVILAHYYTLPEVQEAADFLGDSLALSLRAQAVDAEIILFAGVHFMAETAKVLCPEKKVLIPCPEAGCSLAESCDAGEFAAFKAKYPGHTVVSYVNTTVGVKALTDICCTSSNALKVVESIPAAQPVIIAPDRNLGS